MAQRLFPNAKHFAPNLMIRKEFEGEDQPQKSMSVNLKSWSSHLNDSFLSDDQQEDTCSPSDQHSCQRGDVALPYAAPCLSITAKIGQFIFLGEGPQTPSDTSASADNILREVFPPLRRLKAFDLGGRRRRRKGAATWAAGLTPTLAARRRIVDLPSGPSGK